MVISFVYTNYIYIFAVQILTMRQTTHSRVLAVVIFFSSCRNTLKRYPAPQRKLYTLRARRCFQKQTIFY